MFCGVDGEALIFCLKHYQVVVLINGTNNKLMVIKKMDWKIPLLLMAGPLYSF